MGFPPMIRWNAIAERDDDYGYDYEYEALTLRELLAFDLKQLAILRL